MNFRVIVALVLLFVFSGCATAARRAAAPAPSFIERLCDKYLPADFHGPAHLEERGQYLTITIDAEGLRRGQDGRWTWTWLEYQRTLNIPVFSGVPYRQEGRIRLGTPKQQ